MNLKTNTAILLLLGMLGTSRAAEGDTLQFTLEEAIQYAMEYNLNAENARLDVDAAGERIMETAAIGLPQFNAGLNYNYNIDLATTLIPDFLGDPDDKIEVQFGTKHYATAGLTGSQLIFSGEYIVGLQTARIFREFSESSRQRTEQEVRKLVMQNYYLVLLGKNTLKALRGNLLNVKSSYEETKELYLAGFLEDIDADQLEVTKINLENNVLSMERQIMASTNLLKYQMGITGEVPIQLTDSLPALVAGVDVEATLGASLDLSQNIDYQLLVQQERLAQMDMKLKRTEYLPTLSAFYNLDFTAQRDEFNFLDGNESWYRSSILGLSLNLPIFSSGGRKAGVAQKRIAMEKAQNDRIFIAEGIRVEFFQSKYDFANALEKYRSDQKNLELSQKVVRVTQTKYNEGLASSLELTQVNDQYLQALSTYTASMVELLNAKIRLDQLLNQI